MVYACMKLFFPLLEKLFIKKIKGVENIPRYGPFIIAANHQSHLDGFLLGGYVVKKTGQPIHFLAKQEFTSYFGSWIENLIYKKLAHCILVEKEGTKRKGKLAIAEAAAVLEDEGIVGIFPEGKRTYDGSLLEGRTGIVRILLKAQQRVNRNIPIIPIGIKGANIMLPRKKIIARNGFNTPQQSCDYRHIISRLKKYLAALLRLGFFIPRIWKSRITIKVGKPFYIKIPQKKKRKMKTMTKASLRKQTTIIMKKIAVCAGEHYAP